MSESAVIGKYCVMLLALSCKFTDFSLAFCSPSYNCQGGRRSIHLRTLTCDLLKYTHVFIICGDNELNSSKIDKICRNFEYVIKALHPCIVRFSGFLPRADFDPVLRTKSNLYLAEKLKDRYRSPGLIKKSDFDAKGRDKFHLRHTKNGLNHMMQHCLSFLVDSFGELL